MRRIAFLFTIALGTSATAASAASLCVNPAGSGGCESTIQAAVDAAAAGDVIKIAAGTYREAVVIPAGKDGLILNGGGARKTIIDPNATGDEGLDISSNGVQVIGLAVNNSNTTGVIVNGVDGFVMKKSQIQNAPADCINLAAGSDDAVFESNRFATCNDAVEVMGDRLSFSRNRIANANDDGLFVSGDDAVIEKNSCENVQAECIEVFGANAAVSKNSAVTTNGPAVTVGGGNGLIEKNRAVASGGVATIAGDNPQVLGNTALDSRTNDGINVSCNDGSPECSAARVERNKIHATTNGGDCFDLDFGGTTGAMVLKNAGTRCQDDGLEIAGAAATTVAGNKISRAARDGFEIRGSGVKTVTGNKANLSGDDGFDIADGAHVLEGNKASNNAANGFMNSATGVTMTANTATGNGEEGIDNQGIMLTLTGNKAKNNSLDHDFCNSAFYLATFVDGGGNDFGSTTPPNEATVCLNE